MNFSIGGKPLLLDNQDTDLLGLAANGVDSWGFSIGGYLQAHLVQEKKTAQLHKLIQARMGLTGVCDHINGNPLDNRRCNLRSVSAYQNMCNRKPNKGKKYKGVSKAANRNKYRAQIRINGKQTYIGMYETEEQAAKAYDDMARKLQGEYAKLNLTENMVQN